MKKQLLKSALIALAGVGLLSGSALALSFGTSGSYKFTSAEGTNANFQETLTFFDGTIGSTGLTLHLTSFTLDEADTTSPFTFSPVDYTNGFQILNGSNVVFQADISFTTLQTTGPNAGILNEWLVVNVDEFEIFDTSYSWVNDLYDSQAAVALITFNAGQSIASIINSSTPFVSTSTTYSSSVTAVPEPATMLLFGAGVAGLAGMVRRKK